MTFVRRGGVNRTITSIIMRDNGVQRSIRRVLVRDGNVTRTVFSSVAALSAEANPTTVSGTRIGAGNVDTATTQVTPTGGETPFTYSWAITSGTATILSPSSASTAFRRFVGEGDTALAAARCTVTDNEGTSVTVDVNMIFSSSVEPTPDGDRAPGQDGDLE